MLLDRVHEVIYEGIRLNTKSEFAFSIRSRCRPNECSGPIINLPSSHFMTIIRDLYGIEKHSTIRTSASVVSHSISKVRFSLLPSGRKTSLSPQLSSSSPMQGENESINDDEGDNDDQDAAAAAINDSKYIQVYN